MTHKNPSPDLYVLDALANDIEDLESILRMLNSDTVLGWSDEWGRAFRRDEVVESLSRLIQKGWVQVLVHAVDGKSLSELATGSLPPDSFDDVYFSATGAGRLVHRNWNPPES